MYRARHEYFQNVILYIMYVKLYFKYLHGAPGKYMTLIVPGEW